MKVGQYMQLGQCIRIVDPMSRVNTSQALRHLQMPNSDGT
jgi:hypothetical protein